MKNIPFPLTYKSGNKIVNNGYVFRNLKVFRTTQNLLNITEY